MSFVCLWSPAWQTGEDSSAAHEPHHTGAPARPELAAALLACVPRVAVSARGVLWADARGFRAHAKAALAMDLLALLHRKGVTGARAGVATTPVAAELAAIQGKEGLTVVEPGTDRAFVALFPIDALLAVAGLDPSRGLGPLLFGLGIATCGQLAALDSESVEVRLGADGVALWRLACTDDRRRDTLFAPIPRELPHASLDWTEYVLKDPARLLFVINALLERVCASLIEQGQGAREMAIDFSLSGREPKAYTQPLRAGRPTANRRTWNRIVRTALERLTLPSAVTGVVLRAVRITASETRQGDLFDRGLASAEATEDAIARLIEDQGDVVLVPENSAHPLLDVRTKWVSRERKPTASRTPPPVAVRRTPHDSPPASRLPSRHASPRPSRVPPHADTKPQLTLQLAPQPCPITVETSPRRDHLIPVRYRDTAGWHEVTQVAGPDRVSGNQWEGDGAYAREYFRCVTGDGALVWLFRDGRTVHEKQPGSWYLHGWWD